VFDLSRSPELQRLVEDQGFELEEDQLFISRQITAAGKSSARICGRPAAISQLKEIGDYLVDLHGQHEHQALLAVSRHLDMLDDWGGKDLLEARAQISELYHRVQALRQERTALEKDARERAHLLDLYQFQV